MRQRFTKYILFVATMLAFAACHDDSEPVVHNVTVNTQVVDADEEVGITFRAVINSDVDLSNVDFVSMKISENSDMSQATEVMASSTGIIRDTMYCVVPGLKRDTKYFYSYEIGNYLSTVVTMTKSFNIDKNFNLANVWSQVSSFAGGLRSGGVAFALKGKGYYGLGKSSNRGEDRYYSDLWQYDPNTNTWTQLSNFPSTGLDMAVSFVIGDVAFVALGRYLDASFNGYNTTTFAYDVTSDIWEELTPFPGVGRTGSVCFVEDGKGFIVGGYKEKYGFTNEVWCLDPLLKTWTQKNDFPLALTGCFTFTLKNEVYVGGGYDSKHVANTTLYKYDKASDTWSEAYTGCERLIYSSGFSSDEKCYVAGGEGEIGTESVFLSFDGKEWATLGSFGEIRKKSSSFVLGDSYYLVCGENDIDTPQSSVLKYTIK